MYGIILISVMIITGGAIALIGDKVGTKIGKKRLSIFGLRPRHTSMIITVITGSLITALSIGTLTIVSKDARTALFGMEELNAAMLSTKTELELATNNLLQLQEEFKHADAELGTARQEISTLKSEQEDLRQGNERLELEKAELTAQNENLSDANKELSGVNENLARVNNELSNANKNLSGVNDELTVANAELITANTELTDANNNLAKINGELEINNKKLSDYNVTLTADNEKLTNDNAHLEESAKNLRDGLIAMREGDIAFRAGEILASGVINGHKTVDEIVEGINAIADEASKNVAERFGDNANSAVWIYKPDFKRAIDTISDSNRDMVLRISAASNLMRGEPIRTAITIFPNDKIYKAGVQVFAHEYEVTSNEDAESIVMNFLSEINHEAVAKGVLSDPITGSVGVMEGLQLYELIDEIEQARGKIVLTAYAREDTHAIGPLRLNIIFEQKANI